MFLCYLIVANQYIHLLFPDLFLRANCLYLSNNNFFIQGFSVNHKFRHFWKVFRNFPVHVISRKSRYRLSQPGFDHYYT